MSPAPRGVTRLPLAPDLAALLDVLHRYLRQPGDLLPADPVILSRLWGDGAPTPPLEVGSRLEALVGLGLVRRIFVQREPHIALPRAHQATPAERPEAPVAEPRATIAPSSSTERSADFERLVTLDVERERVLLYRIAIVLEVLVAAVLLRALALTWLGL